MTVAPVTTMTFDPRELDRFKYCCGGYRRWELVEAGGEWWWSLASDWGQAHIADLVMPRAGRLSLRVDLSQISNGVCPSHGTLHLCHRVRVGRLGIDGLPFSYESALSVTLERGRLRLGGDTLAEEQTWPLVERYWGEGPVTLSIERATDTLRVSLEGDEIACVATERSAPALIVVAANSAGVAEAGARFGQIEIDRWSP